MKITNVLREISRNKYDVGKRLSKLVKVRSPFSDRRMFEMNYSINRTIYSCIHSLVDAKRIVNPITQYKRNGSVFCSWSNNDLKSRIDICYTLRAKSCNRYNGRLQKQETLPGEEICY